MVFLLLPRTRVKIPRHDWPHLIGLALLGVVLHFWVQYTAMEMTTATNSSLIIATSPLAVALIASLFFGARLRPQQLLGTAVSYMGVILVVTRGSLDSLWAPGYLLGNVLMVINAFGWVLFTVLGGRMAAKYPPFAVAAWIGILGSVGLLPLGLRAGLLAQLPRLSLEGWAAVLFLATFCTVIGYAGWYYALARLDASRTAVFQYLQPLYTMALSSLLLNEVITWHILLGAVLIVSGLVLASRRRRAPLAEHGEHTG
jgi:drug/metabolite transporter (DMT)-like permease